MQTETHLTFETELTHRTNINRWYHFPTDNDHHKTALFWFSKVLTAFCRFFNVFEKEQQKARENCMHGQAKNALRLEYFEENIKIRKSNENIKTA